MIYYKIRKKDDPTLFVKGTPVYHSYDKTGRIFQSLGALRTFLTGVMNSHYESRRENLGDWEIVELELVVNGVKDLHEVVKPEKIVQLLKR